jgi:hypothetical protein
MKPSVGKVKFIVGDVVIALVRNVIVFFIVGVNLV